MASGPLVDCCLRGAGALATAGCAYAGWKLGTALASECDSLTARASLPPQAFSGKVVWITGASSGIGRELAVQLARHGARLILSARREASLRELATELKGLFPAGGAGEAHVLVLDLEDLDSLDQKVKEALSLGGGRVDILFNNGGISSRCLARDTTGIDLDVRMMKTNHFSHIQLAKGLMAPMAKNGGIRFVNISSLAGVMGVPLRTLYSASKFAVRGWFDALRAEEAGFKSGITVTNVCPGSIRTDVAVNSLHADGSRRGVSDPNIEAGLDVSKTCDRILAAVHSDIDEVWIGPRKELFFAYVSQYFPVTFKKLLKKKALAQITATMGKEFVNSRL